MRIPAHEHIRTLGHVVDRMKDVRDLQLGRACWGRRRGRVGQRRGPRDQMHRQTVLAEMMVEVGLDGERSAFISCVILALRTTHADG